MKIEFRCSQCSRLLRVATEYVGHAMTCPACEASQSVPDPETDPGASHFSVSHRTEVFEPVWNPQAVSLRDVLRETWTLYVENLWLLLGVAFIDLVLWVVGLFLAIAPAVGTFAVLHQAIGVPLPFSVVGMFVVLALGSMTLVNVMTCCQTKFFLKVARGEPVTIMDAFHIGWKKGEVSMLPTIFAAISLSGLVICIVPGVFVYLLFWPYIWVWADQQTGGQDSHAFPLSKDLCTRNMGTSIAVGAIGLVLTIFGFKFFGQSLLGILKAVAYLKMSGQEVTGLARPYAAPHFSFEGADPA